MKVILDNIIFSLQRSGGISTVWYELINKILLDERFDVSFLEYEGTEKNILRKDLNLPISKILNKKTNNKIFIERYKNVSLNIKEPFVFISSYYRICSNKNAINITIAHDFTYEYFRKGVAKFVHSWQKRNALKNSHLIICISENTKKDLLRFYPKIQQKNIEVIYNGVSNIYKKIPDDKGFDIIDVNLGYLNTKKNILFVGSRTSYKNFNKAVDAIAGLDKSYHLLIVGEPLSALEKTDISRKFTENRYTVLERISNEELNLVYNLSHLLLYPSAYEGFGIPLLEAMRCGLPIIAYNSSSIPEVVEEAGILLNDLEETTIKKAIISLENNKFRNELIKKGYDQSSKFSWDKTMNIYLELMNNIYNERQ